jgi:hypothetical protein
MIQRQPRASRHGRKLTPDDVEAILHRLKEETPAVIANDYGISRIMVHGIQTGQKWKHLARKQLVPFQGGFIEFALIYDPRQIPDTTLKQVKALLRHIEQLEVLLKSDGVE